MAEVIATDQLDVPGFKRKPQIDCPAHGLVINPSTGLVAVWSPDIRTAGDILETYDANKHVEATVPDDIRGGVACGCALCKATLDCTCTAGGTSNVSGV